MKRLHIGILFLCALLLLLPMSAFAAGDEAAQLFYVTDEVGILSDTQHNALEEKAAQIAATYEFSPYIIVVANYRDYTSTGDIFDFSCSVYDHYRLGWGENRDGVVLVLSMDDRDYTLNFNGDRAKQVFPGFRQDDMEEAFLAQFAKNDWYGGFDAYLDSCKAYLSSPTYPSEGNRPNNGEEYHSDSDTTAAVLVSLGLGGIAALITGLVMAAPMHTAKAGTNANAYAVRGSLILQGRMDRFLHRSVTRTPRQTQSSSSGGVNRTGSFNHSSGSHSGRSGKF